MSKIKNLALSILTATLLSVMVISCAYQGLLGEHNKEQPHAKQ